MKNLYRVLSIVFGIVVLMTFVWGLINYSYLNTIAEQNIAVYGLIGVFAISFLVDFVPQYVSPHFALATGLFFGLNFYWALFLSIIGSFLGSVLSFELGSLVRAEIIDEISGKKNNDYIKKALNSWGVWFVAVATISPLPYIPLILGSLHMDRKKFYVFGIIPRAIGIAIFGLLLAYIL